MGGSRPLRTLFILPLGRYPHVEITPVMMRTSSASRTGQRPVPPLAGFWVFGGTTGPAVRTSLRRDRPDFFGHQPGDDHIDYGISTRPDFFLG
jgi:hypothetical protein